MQAFSRLVRLIKSVFFAKIYNSVDTDKRRSEKTCLRMRIISQFSAAAVIIAVRMTPLARRRFSVMNYLDNECAHAWLVNQQPRLLFQIRPK